MQTEARSFYKSAGRTRHASAALALRPIAYSVMLACCNAAWANPVGPQVVNGAVSFARPDAKTLNVTSSPGSIINWQGFSIGAGELTRFTQQSSLSAVLNRVVGPDISQLQGQLVSNGRVFLINPAGIVLGAGGMIDTAGFVGSTLNMTNADFLAGKLRFDGAAGGVVRNEGSIRASGDIYLVGPTVENAGVIRSEDGSVVLAAGKSLTIASPDLEGVQFTLQAPTDTAVNLGTIEAKTAAGMFAGTLRHSGDTRAGALTVGPGGNIVLVAQKDLTVDSSSHLTASGTQGGNITVQSGGTTLVSGSVDATGTAGKGGTIHLLGHVVGVMDSATVNASGETGGGTILVGGDFQGKNAAIPNAEVTYFSPDATLKADAMTSGDGGRIIVWADNAARVYGAISARGGAQSGNGGFVETSGHYIDVRTSPDLRAPAGRGGEWLIDPGEITISVTGPDANAVLGANFTPVDPNLPSTLSAGRVSAVVTGNASVTISTGSGPGTGTSSGDIIFDASPAAGGDMTIDKGTNISNTVFTLNAANDIRFVGGKTTFRATAGQSLDVEFNPGGKVWTQPGATTSLVQTGTGLVTARVLAGKTWLNEGTIEVLAGASINLQIAGLTATTLTNNGLMNINLGAGGGNAITSNATNDGIFTNGGTLRVDAPATLQARFSSSGIVTLNNAATILQVPNGGTIGGTVNLNDAAAELMISDGVSTLFSGTTINGTGIVGVRFDPAAPAPFPQPLASFTGVNAATTTTLRTGGRGHAVITGDSTFGNVDVGLGALTGNAGANLTINGNLNITTGATFNGTTTIAGTTALNGTLGGIGAVTGTGALTWTGGGISGTGLKSFPNITTTGTPTLSGNLALDAGIWTNNTTLTQDGDGRVTLRNGATINNTAPSGIWLLAATSTDATPIVNGASAVVNAFNNAGTFTKNNAIAVSILAPGPATGTFNNTGTVNVNDGTLTLPAGSGVSDTGTFNVPAPATLIFNGARILAAGSDVAGAGTVRFSSGTVRLAGNYSLAGTGTTIVDNGDAVFNTAPLVFASPYTLSSGTLEGSANLRFNDSFTWSGGTIGGTGTLDTRGITGITGAVALQSRAWTNNGTVNMTGAGQLTLLGGALVTNASIWNLSSTSATPFASGAGVNRFDNGGTLDITGTVNRAITTSTFTNSGATVVHAGTLTLPAGNGSEAGTFNVQGGGATLVFNDTRDLGIGSDVSGPGIVRFTGGVVTLGGNYTATAGTTRIDGGTAVFNTAGPLDFNANALTLSGGQLGGTSAITASKGFVWSGGALTGTGAFSTPSTANVTGVVTLDGRTWNNTGTVEESGASRLNLANNAVLNNALGGVWNLRSTDAIPITGPTGTLTNAGTFNALQTGVTGMSTIAVGALANPGTINVRAGTLQVNGGFPINQGTIDVGAATTFSTNGAALTNNHIVKGSGTIDLNGAMLTNNATVAPGASPGTLVVIGDYTQGPAGILNIELGGVSQGVSYDLLQVTGTANLDGTLNVVTSGGFAPAAGNAFSFLTYANHTGDFATLNYPVGTAFQAAAGANAYAVSLPAAVPGATRDLALDETERLRANLFNLVTTNTLEEPGPRGSQVCR